ASAAKTTRYTSTTTPSSSTANATPNNARPTPYRAPYTTRPPNATSVTSEVTATKLAVSSPVATRNLPSGNSVKCSGFNASDPPPTSTGATTQPTSHTAYTVASASTDERACSNGTAASSIVAAAANSPKRPPSSIPASCGPRSEFRRMRSFSRTKTPTTTIPP